MRLWSLHPRYLDARGLVALWREALLAQAVLRGATRGYVTHPQLARFRDAPSPLSSIAEYLRVVHAEAEDRGYVFDARKIAADSPRTRRRLLVTDGQVEFEWNHLMRKLRVRAPEWYRQVRRIERPDPHPLFRVVDGEIGAFERVR